MSQQLFLTPLFLLPGVALLVLSTSARYSSLHTEVHHQIHDENGDPCGHHLRRRARLFRNVLVCLYSAICLLSLAALSGGVMKVAGLTASDGLVLGLSVFAVALVVVATALLVHEATLSLQVIEDHLNEIPDSAPRRRKESCEYR